MFKKVGFIGLGLMGGAIAKSLKKYNLAEWIIGYDRDKLSLQEAFDEGIIDTVAKAIDETFADCDLIFLCCPVKINVAMAKKLKGFINKDCLLTDIGSTKSDIHNAIADFAPEQPFIGGHPMTGSEKTGFKNGSPILFENIYYVLTPSTSASSKQLEELTSLVRAIDSIPVIMDPKVHDDATAAISHVPHILAATMVNAVRLLDQQNGHMHMLAAGGFKDLTRIASGSPEMWESICLANKEAILEAMDATIEVYKSFRDNVADMNSSKLLEAFTEAKDYRDSFSERQPGLLPRDYSFAIDVDDEPGIIARIATLLYEANINIKNIGIVNNRETEEGVLKIHFDEEKDMLQSIDLLKRTGSTVYL